ncbi:uncharacterized protein BO96DRAFT_493900 [Aspergillus niger CBS 101883]|uniref:uncharacterized protein n=1 Tax=Aspergillus lacticoffeatus (strain CBS 101883) TaxID=1450533 RepID=UPI000D7F480B|nr:uncharacterized protein BO96DRAFT_493900 [Aspergillus niger CBS 101883]PYH57675.1 hypothetical protein BO96DRAFT_493900 [Aspergillus niger CBS 101883]
MDGWMDGYLTGLGELAGDLSVSQTIRTTTVFLSSPTCIACLTDLATVPHPIAISLGTIREGKRNKPDQERKAVFRHSDGAPVGSGLGPCLVVVVLWAGLSVYRGMGSGVLGSAWGEEEDGGCTGIGLELRLSWYLSVCPVQVYCLQMGNGRILRDVLSPDGKKCLSERVVTPPGTTATAWEPSGESINTLIDKSGGREWNVSISLWEWGTVAAVNGHGVSTLSLSFRFGGLPFACSLTACFLHFSC